MSSPQNPAEALTNLTADQHLELLRSVTSVCRTGQWLNGNVATDAERATCRSLLRKVNLALLASGQHVTL
jgi:hypothetical protein